MRPCMQKRADSDCEPAHEHTEQLRGPWLPTNRPSSFPQKTYRTSQQRHKIPGVQSPSITAIVNYNFTSELALGSRTCRRSLHGAIVGGVSGGQSNSGSKLKLQAVLAVSSPELCWFLLASSAVLAVSACLEAMFVAVASEWLLLAALSTWGGPRCSLVSAASPPSPS